MDSDPMLFFIFLIMLYILFRDLQPRTGLPARQLGVPAGEEAPHPEGREPYSDPLRVDQERANSRSMPVRDADRAFEHGHAAIQALEEKTFPGPPAGSSTSAEGDHREQPNAIVASASQFNVLPVNPTQPVSSADPVTSTISVSTLGPSLVKKFAGLRVNTTYSFLASGRSATRDRTPFSSPLSSLPPSPTLPSSLASFQTPVASRERPGASSYAVDFSLYKKKTRVLTKSPKKPQTKAAGKLPAREPPTDATTTTWFYKTSTGSQLLDAPPDLTGHPDGLALGDVYFDCVADRYQLWLWCLDNVGALHWKKIPFGYEREDGKHLIVTRKIHFLSWVTAKYYKELINDESSTSMDVDED